ncbi:hypothetical protein [Vibrio neptunius]|uniref:CcoH n=1 Tax=Vibrio neptunius TaxID=170651 RepID=A0ABS3A7D8_9VIBR|nr:hypothetical protein [Vibrio neptunius]MBN3494682.1 hypothetical protein [Vibrio neptunius]MBN3517172.1 hypothetical protein [Vibrio neptunius]MBN3551276.1 hypothetical protein [Vibrio neptunius]MBN3579567.1 hypothetical protein [Vibrio neptunius]MCH9873232.1 hypothetical protein [Vibrio neptunius]
MSKAKLIIIIFISALSLLLAYVFIPTHVRLGQEIVNRPIAEGVQLVGYKATSTDPKDGKLNHYFLLAQGQSAKETQPFLITSDPFIRVESVVDNKLYITITGRVTTFNSDLWITKTDGTAHHWLISANIKYIR